MRPVMIFLLSICFIRSSVAVFVVQVSTGLDIKSEHSIYVTLCPCSSRPDTISRSETMPRIGFSSLLTSAAPMHSFRNRLATSATVKSGGTDTNLSPLLFSRSATNNFLVRFLLRGLIICDLSDRTSCNRPRLPHSQPTCLGLAFVSSFDKQILAPPA